MKKFLRIALIIVVALIFIWTFVFLYQKSQPKATVYETQSPELGTIEQSTVATGKIEPRDEIEIKPQVSGIIAEVYKEAGQTVRQGDIIAKVKVIPDMGQLSSAESRVRLANISLQKAKADYERAKNLYEGKLISADDFEQAEVTMNKAKEELAAAEDDLNIVKEGISKSNAQLSSTFIRSTITGLILDVPVKVGNSVILSNTFNDGTTIASVADMSDMIFKGKIDETEVGRIKEGMPVKITLGALQGVALDARLEFVSPKGVEENGANQFELKAAITVPDSITIRSGYSANAAIILNKAENVLTIPEGLVEFSGDTTFVYVLTDTVPQQNFDRRQVTLGLSDGVNVEVKEGISQSDVIRGALKEEQY